MKFRTNRDFNTTQRLARLVEAILAKEIWISLSAREREILTKALDAYIGGEAAKPNAAAALIRKIARAKPHPEITVGVYGGQVQWSLGNPFPIRVVDYDGDANELPNRDEQGHPCRIWFEPPDKTNYRNSGEVLSR